MFGRAKQKPVLSLALQGGGAHGAFTWGVLDALLEREVFRFDGLSGSSAGAMNAVALAHGWTVGGAEGARQALNDFWERVGETLPGDMLEGFSTAGDSAAPPSMQFMLSLSRWFSPYQLNPFDYNPLRKIVETLFDFDRIRRECPFQLFVATTHANSGKLRLFRNDDICADALLASACLPTAQQAVLINDAPYWDGGFAANPAVFPLLRFCDTDDIMLVLLAPFQYEETPRRAEDIRQRQMELGFNSAFLREMRLIAVLREMAAESGPIRGKLERRLLAARFHMVEETSLFADLDASSRVRAQSRFLRWLRDAGRESAFAWLATNYAVVGRSGTVDVKALFY